MQMGLQENPHTSWWLSNDVESSDDHEYRHASPYEREPMFEKPLTPSDVGKLNRLVIPKQHAEKHFPLSGDAAGTLLGFEDEVGKCWRFRYSYWNSSQSYVLTKGWSRYVKEKRLDAGDVIFFERHRAEPRRVFIGWRRRGSAPMQPMGYFQVHDTWGQIHAAPAARVVAEVATQVEEATAGSSNNRRLVRLFGVNLECEHENPSSSSQTTSSSSEISFMSGQQQLQQPPYGYYFDYNTRHPHHSYHMEMNFLQGVNQMGNGLG